MRQDTERFKDGSVRLSPTRYPPYPHLHTRTAILVTLAKVVFLINFQMVDVKVRVAPSLPAALPPQQINQLSINIPVKWLRVGPTPVALIQSPAFPLASSTCCRRVNFSVRGSRCPLRASQQREDGEGGERVRRGS